MGLLESEELKLHKDAVKKRFDQAMTPSHFLANMLHPAYAGKKLSLEQIYLAQAMVLEEDPDLVPDLLLFLSGQN